jgi:hypothetical protein
MSTSPQAPGRLGSAPTAQQMLEYLGQLDAWLAERRAELDTLDAQVIATSRQAELTGDMSLALALWQAAKIRQNLLLATWDSGRVQQQELERLSALIWGRLDTTDSQLASLQSMAVSLPEAGRLCDALVAQLRTQLNTDPNAMALEMRLRDLRAQAERIRDQLTLEPPALAPAGQAKLDTINAKITELSEKRSRGGDITGSLSTLEIDAARLERDLIVGASRRREGRDLLTKAREGRTEVSAREFAVRTFADQVTAAVWPAPADQLPQVSGLGPLPNTTAALTGYVAALADLDVQLTAAQSRLGQLLAERDAAAALLSALRAKAESLGQANDPRLSELSGLIGARLAATPVVLPAVQQLLAAYSTELDYLSGNSR